MEANGKRLVVLYVGGMRERMLHGTGRLYLFDNEAGSFNEYIGRFADGQPEGDAFV